MIQNQEKEQEILTMKQHIHILQQEHLAKISHIAELEAQLQYLKVITWSVLQPVVQTFYCWSVNFSLSFPVKIILPAN